MSYKISAEDCEAWEKNKEVNPITGRNIKVGGPVYTRFEQECHKHKKEQSRATIKQDVVFDQFKNRTLKKTFELQGMKVVSRITDNTVLVIVKDSIAAENESPLITTAIERQIPIQMMNEVELLLRINKHSENNNMIPRMISIMKESQYKADDGMKTITEIAAIMLELAKAPSDKFMSRMNEIKKKNLKPIEMLAELKKLRSELLKK